jgi:hypothetical protein
VIARGHEPGECAGDADAEAGGDDPALGAELPASHPRDSRPSTMWER